MKIAILDALPSAYWKDDGGYTDGEKFIDLLSPWLTEAEFSIYYVAEGNYPTSINEYDGIVSSGSAASVHDDDEWISRLADSLMQASSLGKKIIGTCFSHQLIAKLHGGTVEKNENGWMIGNHALSIEASYHWMQPRVASTSIHHFNEERVSRLPALARAFASCEYYGNSGYTIGDHIVCVQGHPEQSTQSISNWLASMNGLMPDDEFQLALRHTGSGNPDNELWARWFSAFLRG